METKVLEELWRARFVTENYPKLQGLRMVSIGGFCLLMAAGRGGPWRWFEAWDPLSSMAVLCVSLGAFWAVGRYYGRGFGSVRYGAPNGGDRETVVWRALVAVLALSVVVDAMVGPAPVDLIGLMVAGWLMVCWWQAGKAWGHYVFLAVVLALVSSLPLLGVASLGQISGVAVLGILGVILIIGGVLDHVTLARDIQPYLKDSD